MKTYLVTGASRGIGKEIARALAQAGHGVIATARSAQGLNELAKAYPEQVVAVSADLSTDTGCAALARYGPLDGVAHAAGLLINKPFHDLKDEDWARMWDVNVMSAVRLARHLSPVFATGAHVVLIGSMGGVQGSSKYPGLSGYSATKGALCVLTECLATEWRDRGVSVNCLALGAVQTDMLAQAFPGYQAPVSAERMGSFVATFLTTSGDIQNGKILHVSLNNP